MEIKASWIPVGFISEVNKTQQSEKKVMVIPCFSWRASSTYYTFWFFGGDQCGSHWDLDDFAFHYIKYGGRRRGKADPNETSSLKIPSVVRNVSEEKLNMTTIFEEEEGNVKAVSR